MATLKNKLRVLCDAIENISDNRSQEVVEWVQEDLIPQAEQLEDENGNS